MSKSEIETKESIDQLLLSYPSRYQQNSTRAATGRTKAQQKNEAHKNHPPSRPLHPQLELISERLYDRLAPSTLAQFSHPLESLLLALPLYLRLHPFPICSHYLSPTIIPSSPFSVRSCRFHHHPSKSSLIVSYLRTPISHTVNENIPNGKSLSLVCRRFVPIGQALRWRIVKIDPSSIHSLAQHFEDFPHLAKLVRLLAHTILPGETDKDEEEEEPAFQAQSLDDLLHVLTSTTSLIYLEFKADNNESSRSALHRIFRTTGALPQLREFILEIPGTDAWTPEVARAFSLGFHVLDSLTLDLDIDSTPGDGFDAALASGPRIPIEDLTAFIGGRAVDTMRLGFDLFNRLDPSALRRCALGGPIVHDINYEFLPTCSSLTRLEITMCPQDVLISSSALFDHLPRLTCLEFLEVYVFDRETATFELGETNISLQRVLAALPPSLKIIHAAISLEDYETIPRRGLPESPKSLPARLTAVRPLVGGDYQVVHVWKEDAGRAEWYRGELEGEDWRAYFV